MSLVVERFDPFEDRLCRDIRNDLSEALRRSLATGSPAAFRETAADFLARDLAPVYTEYLHDRLARFEVVLAEISKQGISRPLDRALVLWDQALFFEAHEVLEAVWMQAEGAERLALQGLIRAVGVYVHLEVGHGAAAGKMAAKAVQGLEENHAALGETPWLGRLLEKLRALDPVPPQLRTVR
jgi:hypothetical protein